METRIGGSDALDWTWYSTLDFLRLERSFENKALKKNVQDLDTIYFHPSSFKSPPFLTIPIAHDWMGHTIPGGILQSQPMLGTYISNTYR
jgi:hypothetical protein